MSAETDKQNAAQAGVQGTLLRSEDVISQLRMMLAMAEKGEIIAAVIVGQKRDHLNHYSSYSGAIDVPSITGEMGVVRAALEQLELGRRHQAAQGVRVPRSMLRRGPTG